MRREVGRSASPASRLTHHSRWASHFGFRPVDLPGSASHTRRMDFDISRLLGDWDFKPGQVVVRRFKGQDGQEKLQLRLDLGVLQMNAEGRPDGKRPFGYVSLFEYYQARLYKHLANHDGSDDAFRLTAEDCAKLHLEALQYHQRCFCLLQLEDYPAVIRDAERNLAVLDFLTKHVGSDELTWSLRQFLPQLLMVLTRARGAQALQKGDYPRAIQQVEEGLEQVRAFYRDTAAAEDAEASGEVLALVDWLDEIRSSRPISQRERLERALQRAVNSEDYERAAKVRDKLKNLKSVE